MRPPAGARSRSDRVGTIATIRDASAQDLAAILQLNRESEAYLSPLSPERLAALHRQAWYHRVAERDGELAAFLIALGPGADYDSPNYRWFSERHADFVYIDRIVVGASSRGARLATALYQDLLGRARRSGVARVTCEFDTDPPNEVSRAFHERFGFVEVGAQRVGTNRKRVSLQQLVLGDPVCSAS
jgi:predicted GNAT superfamily acetyltransferase